MESPNPFKELEPDAVCPPHLKTELMSEIDLMRSVLTVVDQYVGDLVGTALTLLAPPHDPTLPV